MRVSFFFFFVCIFGVPWEFRHDIHMFQESGSFIDADLNHIVSWHNLVFRARICDFQLAWGLGLLALGWRARDTHSSSVLGFL